MSSTVALISMFRAMPNPCAATDEPGCFPTRPRLAGWGCTVYNPSMPHSAVADQRRATRESHRIHSLSMIVLMPHGGCNCRCVMCDIWKANSKKLELTLDDLAPLVREIRQLGVRLVTLSGGEAM